LARAHSLQSFLLVTTQHSSRSFQAPAGAQRSAEASQSKARASKPHYDDAPAQTEAAGADDAEAQPAKASDLSEWFQRAACVVAQRLGSPWAFFGAVLLIVAWAASGPLFQFNETWQLVINTSTTIITFLMVFLIQSTQNRDSKALHLKLDELIRASEARNVFADLEDASERELDAFQREFRQLHRDGVRGLSAAVEAGKAHKRRRATP
jgi:low affinity Fe/Cu permease